MKNKRHDCILEIIQEKAISTQEELQKELRKRGYEVTQATVSRDIRRLRLVKQQTEDGRNNVFREFVLPNGEEAALRCLVEWRHAAEQSGAEITFQARDRSSHLTVPELLPLIAEQHQMSEAERALLYALFDGA